ncbi:MAG: T9SS type A sorting domain-containing protein [Candidatus Kapaibacteriota bacterium]
MKKFLTLLAASAMISAPAFAQMPIEINYAKEGGDSKYDAIKFFSADGKYASDKDVTMVVFTDKMHPLASEVTPDGPASMNGAAKCLLHSGAGIGFWANAGRSADGTKTTFDADGWRNEAIGMMTQQAPNIFSLTFNPSKFYATDVVTHYGMVFNDGKDGKAEGKAEGLSDYKLIIAAPNNEPKEIPYTKEGGDTGYDAIKFFSPDGNYSSDKEVEMVVFTDKMHPLASEVTPDGPASMNGAAKCLLHSGAGIGFWANAGRSADGTKTTFDADGWRNEAIGMMTQQAPNVFSYKFVPKTFYNTDVVTHYGMVFNDGKDGKAEGKAEGLSDYKLIITGNTTTVRDGQGTAYDLSPVFPNPTSNTEVSMIRYRVLNNAQPIAVRVFDIRGNLVRTLVNEMQVPANYLLYWDKTDANNAPVSSGSYIYTIESGSYRTSGTIIVNN